MSVDNILTRPMFIEPGTKKKSLVQWNNVGVMDGFSQEGNLKFAQAKIPTNLADVNQDLTIDRNTNNQNFNLASASEVTSGGDFAVEKGDWPKGMWQGEMDLGGDPKDPRYEEWGGGEYIGLEDIGKKLGYKIWRDTDGRFYVDEEGFPDYGKDVTDQVNALVSQGVIQGMEAPLIPKTNGESAPIIPETPGEKVKKLTFEERLLVETPEEKRIKAELKAYDPKAIAKGYMKEFVGKEPTLDQRFDQMKRLVAKGDQNDNTDLLALRLITDLFTLKSPYQGKWEQAFDIMAQTVGRETERVMMKRQSKSQFDKELAMKAIDQHNSSKENELARNAQFWLQSMGADVDMTKFRYGLETDFAIQGLRQAGSEYLAKLKATLDPSVLKGKAVNLAITDPSSPNGYRIGTGIVAEDGTIKKLMGEDEKGELLYQPISEDDFVIPAESPLNETLAGKPQGKMMDLRLDYFNLQNARDVLSQIVQEELTAQKEGKSYLGIQGVIDGLTQEATFTFNDMLRTISPKLEAKFFNASNDMYIQDLLTEGTLRDQTPVTRDMELGVGMFEIEVPKKGLFGEGTEKKMVEASVRDLLNQSYWEGQGYDPVYAYNKVRENILIYAIARALKPTGRLNVDDIRRASTMVDLTGVRSSQGVLAKLRAVDNRLNQGQMTIIQTLGDVKIKLENDEPKSLSVEDIINQGVGQN